MNFIEFLVNLTDFFNLDREYWPVEDGSCGQLWNGSDGIFLESKSDLISEPEVIIRVDIEVTVRIELHGFNPYKDQVHGFNS